MSGWGRGPTQADDRDPSQWHQPVVVHLPGLPVGGAHPLLILCHATQHCQKSEVMPEAKSARSRTLHKHFLHFVCHQRDREADQCMAVCPNTVLQALRANITISILQLEWSTACAACPCYTPDSAHATTQSRCVPKSVSCRSTSQSRRTARARKHLCAFIRRSSSSGSADDLDQSTSTVGAIGADLLPISS